MTEYQAERIRILKKKLKEKEHNRTELIKWLRHSIYKLREENKYLRTSIKSFKWKLKYVKEVQEK
jgi:hypothetical protein